MSGFRYGSKKGQVNYRREGSVFQMASHINSVDGMVAERIIVCCEGGAYSSRISSSTR